MKPPAVEIDDARRHLAEKHPVVRDEKERRPASEKEILEQGDGVDVQVIGGLVEQQEVRTVAQPTGDENPAHDASRQRPEFGVRVEAQAGDRRVGGLFYLPAVPSGDDIVNRTGQAGERFLRHEGDLEALPANDLPGIRRDFAMNEAEKRGLPRSVAADQADPLSRLDPEVDAVEQGRTAEGDADAAQIHQCQSRSPVTGCEKRVGNLPEWKSMRVWIV